MSGPKQFKDVKRLTQATWGTLPISEIEMIRGYDLDAGLRPLLDSIGYFEDPAINTKSTGLETWTCAEDLELLLTELLPILPSINSWYEIGTFKGGGFVFFNELFCRYNPNVKGQTSDITPQCGYAEAYKNYAMNEVTFHKVEKADLTSVDLVIIDGDHTYNGVKRDFEIAIKANVKYIVFHDAVNVQCPGIVKLLSEIKDKHSVKFLNAMDKYMGYAVVYNLPSEPKVKYERKRNEKTDKPGIE